jgi:hypothetical protein
MVIELRKVKYSASLSEETAAFTADLYFDGVKVGTASNHGTGGPNDTHIPSALHRSAFAEFIANEPPEPCEWGDKTPLKMTEDFFISNLIEDFLEAKDKEKTEKRIQKLAAKARLSGCVALVVNFKGFAIETMCKQTNVEKQTAAINEKYGKGTVGTVRVVP